MSKQDVYAAQSAYESALATYEAFREEHKDVIDDHDHLAVLLAESLDAYKNTLRENHALFGKKVGAFTVTVPKTYDVEVLRKRLGKGADPYLKVSYSVDSKLFEDAVEKGRVARDVADDVVGSGTPRVSGGPKAPSIYQR